MKDRRGEVWMYDNGVREWAVAVITSLPWLDRDGSAVHGCIQLAGSFVHSHVGSTTWHEYFDRESWEVDVNFTRLA